ncbi:MAG: hypothetical protein ABL973_04160 [Micropepsaceae bacterium]
MSTTSLPPHLAAQSFASQPVQRRQPQPQSQPQSAPTGGGFEALALKSANPSRVITGKPVEIAAAVAAPVTPAVQARPPVSALDELTRLSRPGSILDIRV